MGKLILTVKSEIDEDTLLTIQEYANKVGADYIEMDIPLNYTMYEFSHGIPPEIKNYNRILYIHPKIEVKDHAPDIFSMFNSGICAVREEFHLGKKRVEQASDYYGDYDWGQECFRSEVILFSKEHLDIFDNDNEDLPFEIDINYLIQKREEMILPLHVNWNFIYRWDSDFQLTSEESFFLNEGD